MKIRARNRHIGFADTKTLFQLSSNGFVSVADPLKHPETSPEMMVSEAFFLVIGLFYTHLSASYFYKRAIETLRPNLQHLQATTVHMHTHIAVISFFFGGRGLEGIFRPISICHHKIVKILILYNV